MELTREFVEVKRLGVVGNWPTGLCLKLRGLFILDDGADDASKYQGGKALAKTQTPVPERLIPQIRFETGQPLTPHGVGKRHVLGGDSIAAAGVAVPDEQARRLSGKQGRVPTSNLRRTIGQPWSNQILLSLAITN